MPFHIHLSRADPSEAGVDQRIHLLRRRRLAGLQEIGELARALLYGHLRTSFALASAFEVFCADMSELRLITLKMLACAAAYAGTVADMPRA
jgi:hypothetical protein